MTTVVISALLLSAIIYLYIGLSLGKQNHTLGDLFPVVFGRNARIRTVDEFSASTVATTVSLATIILAYFELAGYFGVWLLWTAITTAIGMLLVSFSAKQIWKKLAVYNHRPSMHEFIGVEFNSKSVAMIASACTTLGFLLIFATELVVGSQFLAGLVPTIPTWVSVIFLSGVGFVYTLRGGFYAVIKTDQYQMKFIWMFIFTLGGYYVYYILQNGGLNFNLNKIPSGLLSFSSKEGLGFFLLGIAIMNIPTHISNMSIWQRISGASDHKIVEKGIRNSIWGIGLSWTCLSLLACFAYMIVSPANSQALLADLLQAISGSVIGKIVLFFTVLGLYGAMLSTASTNLIVIGHTVSEDIVAKFRNKSLNDRIDSKKEFLISRVILVFATIVAIFLVAGLKWFGFSIADLVFAIYGGALALFPPIVLALYSKREKLNKLSSYVNIAVISGFISGWGAAIYGKIIKDANLIFLSPGISILTSGLILSLGIILIKLSQRNLLKTS